MTSRSEIKEWLGSSEEMKKEFSHMIVVCDTYDYEDYPVYVNRNENVQEVIDNYSSKPMQQIMEVYSYDLNIFDQLGSDRVWNI